ncbi:MAG: helix-turn-helix transcriptional regulator [Burkholderiales bacterium]|nr:helix-turn-helix transcriptional regulator [Burkholderiales bacterium]
MDASTTEATTARGYMPSGHNPLGDFAWRVLEEIDYGLILVGPEGELQHANHLARHELAKGRYLRVDDAHVVATHPSQTADLLRGIEWAAHGRRQMLALQGDSGALTVACVPLGHPFEGQAGSVLLMLSRRTGTQGLAVSFFARLHGLTPAEEGVLKALCEGHDVCSIAALNGVAESTVRTQVRSLRNKTGISSMRLLVQHIAGLPPLVPVVLGVEG